MEHLKASGRLSAAVTSLVLIFSGILRLNGQINTACTSSALSTFTPCFNYLTGSSGNGSSPTEDCCNTLKSAMTDSMDCACLIVTGNVPVSIPFVRTLALSLPQQCNSGVPVQCKATGVPLPAPGSAILPPPQSPSPHYRPPRSPSAHPPAGPQSPSPHYRPPRSPSAHPPAAAPPRSQRAAAVSVVKMEKPTSPPTSAVEPPTTPTEKPAAAPQPKPPLFIPNATPAGIRPVIDPTPTSANSSYTISSSPSSLLLLYLAFLNMFLC